MMLLNYFLAKQLSMTKAAAALFCSSTDLYFGEMVYKRYQCFITGHKDAVNTAHYVCQLLWLWHCKRQQNYVIYQYWVFQ